MTVATSEPPLMRYTPRVPTMILARAITLAALVTGAAHAQWQIQTSNTTADLRGIHNVGNGVAWASGTNGTVLRTEDGGYVWQTCTVPPGAEKLDFRGIQAFDANTAIVLSSGKGDLSRLYKTTDGCHTWKLLFDNPSDPDGFWDSFQMWSPEEGFLAGDPVDGFLYFAELSKWSRVLLDQGEDPLWKAKPGEAAFAASNGSLALGKFDPSESGEKEVWFATGGVSGSRVFHYEHLFGGEPERDRFSVAIADSFPKGDSAGIFAIAVKSRQTGVAVGGDYEKADATTGTAAYSSDGNTWHPSATPPHGYRSSVAYNSATKTWITVGPNGTDISTDDGRNWRAIHPNATLHEAPDADRNWNAISLPYVVGPKGRIGKLDESALK